MNNDLTNKTEKPNLSPDFTLDYDDVKEDKIIITMMESL
jgi:hypothetical protein